MPTTKFFEGEGGKVTTSTVFDCESCDAQLPAGHLCKIYGDDVLELSRHVDRPIRNGAWVCLDCAQLSGAIPDG
jgi:hypothetical protein